MLSQSLFPDIELLKKKFYYNIRYEKILTKCGKTVFQSSSTHDSTKDRNCVKSVRIRSISDPYSVQKQGNRDQKNFKYVHFSRSENDLF